MARWDAALYTDKLLKRASLEQMWTPVKLNDGKTHDYGFGWNVTKAGRHRVVEHGGAWQGFVSHIVRYPDDGMTVVVFANLVGSNIEKIAHAVAAIYRPELGAK
jgi:CubicO group peptidase (beta-lactamase class C family)